MAEWDRLAGRGMSARRAVNHRYAGLPCRRFRGMLAQMFPGKNLRAPCRSLVRGGRFPGERGPHRPHLTEAGLPRKRDPALCMAKHDALEAELEEVLSQMSTRRPTRRKRWIKAETDGARSGIAAGNAFHGAGGEGGIVLSRSRAFRPGTEESFMKCVCAALLAFTLLLCGAALSERAEALALPDAGDVFGEPIQTGYLEVPEDFAGDYALYDSAASMQVNDYRARLTVAGYVEEKVDSDDIRRWTYSLNGVPVLVLLTREDRAVLCYLNADGLGGQEAEGNTDLAQLFPSSDAESFPAVCLTCFGSGACPICGGTGVYHNYGISLVCGFCDGTGVCPTCGGKGIQ